MAAQAKARSRRAGTPPSTARRASRPLPASRSRRARRPAASRVFLDRSGGQPAVRTTPDEDGRAFGASYAWPPPRSPTQARSDSAWRTLRRVKHDPDSCRLGRAVAVPSSMSLSSSTISSNVNPTAYSSFANRILRPQACPKDLYPEGKSAIATESGAARPTPGYWRRPHRPPSRCRAAASGSRSGGRNPSRGPGCERRAGSHPACREPRSSWCP